MIKLSDGQSTWTLPPSGAQPETVMAPVANQSGVDAILAERQKTHGDFETHAQMAQALKDQMRTGKQWPHLNAAQREALEMIQHKIARILNGDPNHPDHWDDLGGYSKLGNRQPEGGQ